MISNRKCIFATIYCVVMTAMGVIIQGSSIVYRSGMRCGAYGCWSGSVWVYGKHTVSILSDVDSYNMRTCVASAGIAMGFYCIVAVLLIITYRKKSEVNEPVNADTCVIATYLTIPIFMSLSLICLIVSFCYLTKLLDGASMDVGGVMLTCQMSVSAVILLVFLASRC